jgi:hypothetical protein
VSATPFMSFRDVWIQTQSAAVASWRATDLATYPSTFKNMRHIDCQIFKSVFIFSFK